MVHHDCIVNGKGVCGFCGLAPLTKSELSELGFLLRDVFVGSEARFWELKNRYERFNFRVKKD